MRETKMTAMRFWMLALFIAAAGLITAGTQHASAMPIQMLSRAEAGVVAVACDRGEPNCLPADSSAPVMCGGPANPCVMDGAPDCQNASSCGTDNTGDHNLNGASNMPGVISDAVHPSGGENPKPNPGAAMKAK
jgi:hypothetical protein